MLWIVVKCAEYGLDTMTYAMYGVYQGSRYLMYGKEQSDEAKQLLMVRSELEHLREQQERLLDELKKYHSKTVL